MHPDFRLELVNQQERRLGQALDRSRLLADGTRRRASETPLVLRLCTVRDDETLEQLALLSGQRTPEGRFVVAEVDGEVVAALPLGGGEPLTDPFRPTAHLLPLLRLRAAQLADQPRARLATAKAIAARVLHPAR
jgi:hypothetical protein